LPDSGSARGERRRIREDRIGEDYEQSGGIVLVAHLDGDPELTGNGLGGAQLVAVGPGDSQAKVVVAAARERRAGALRRIMGRVFWAAYTRVVGAGSGLSRISRAKSSAAG
jgi:hypothetical protein